MLLSTHEIATRWKVSDTWVSILCKQGRINGAIKEGKCWKVPEEAAKPIDKRTLRKKVSDARFRFVDLFAGIGGFHQAMRYLGGDCLMAAEINQECVKTYSHNFMTIEKEIRGDVNKIDPNSIPHFNEKTPDGVFNAEYDCVLDTVVATEENEIVAWIREG